MKLLREITTNTFTHNGEEYSLTKLNKLVKGSKVDSIKLKDLEWIFKYDNPLIDTPERIKTANINVPILVTMSQGKLVVLDGLHRLGKAKIEGKNVLPGIMVNKEQLKGAKL